MYDSIVRTLVPVIVGVLLGQAARIGLSLPEGAVTELVTMAVTGVYYAGARWLEQQWPVLGRVLLSAGLAGGTNPVYSRTTSGRARRLPRM